MTVVVSGLASGRAGTKDAAPGALAIRHYPATPALEQLQLDKAQRRLDPRNSLRDLAEREAEELNRIVPREDWRAVHGYHLTG